ncbi:MAG: phenylalanine--tRNA ligase subunit beta, partial [Patescibacteria group bacterium]
IACEKHPNADKLNVCLVDDGGVNKNVERDSDGYVQVVCGAPNARVDLTTIWIPPSVVVPSTYGKDPLELEAREIRGQVSNGMLASLSELAIGGDHNGIVEIDQEASPVQTFADAYKLNDYIIDIENKMFTHRPDLFGMMGVAREIAGIQGQSFKSPDWYLTPLPIEQASELPLTVENQIPELAPRFMAVAMSGIEIKPSPLWLQINLTRVGIKPINNIVDLTNYFMMLTAQPLHAYDYDKVKALSASDAKLVIRAPKIDEKIKLLGGKVIEPKQTDIMIATDKQLIGIGGVMGGADTEIDANTKNIILECANFDMYTTRRTSMAHGLFTDASTRFTKGQSPQQCPSVFAKAVDDIKRLTTGKVASPVINICGNIKANKTVVSSTKEINQILGTDLSAEQIVSSLKNTEFDLIDDPKEINPDIMEVTAPFWRTDIEILEDVAEEVGRLYGFNKLPKSLPNRTTSPPIINQNIVLKEKLRDVLFNLGANEVMTYNFVHGDLLTKVGQKPEQSYKLRNALSPDLQYYRQSLTPSLLDKVHSNIKAGYDKFAIFEIGKAHIKGREEDNLPIEFERLAFVFSADPKAAKTIKGAPYYQAKKYLEELFDRLGIKDIRFEDIVLDGKDTNEVYYQKGRSATVYSGEHLLGRIGEYTPATTKAFKLPDF